MSTPLRNAQDSLLIEDVYLLEGKAWTHANFDPIVTPPEESGALRVQILCRPNENITFMDADVPTGKEVRVRYSIQTGVRILMNGANPDQIGSSNEGVFAEITGVFAARYVVKKDSEAPSKEMLAAFADNAVHHVWPYWREFVQATASRLRLPPVMIPMRVVRQAPSTPPGSEPNKRIAKQSGVKRAKRAKPARD